MKVKILAIILIISIIGCVTPIRRIANKPEKLHGKNVRVRGIVVSSVELEDLDIFYIANKTKKHNIAVITNHPLPRINQFVFVKGTVINNYTYQNRYIQVVISEKDSLNNFTISDIKYRKPRYRYLNKSKFRFEDFNFSNP